MARRRLPQRVVVPFFLGSRAQRNFLYLGTFAALLLKGSGGADGTRTRDLRRDRPAL